MYAECCKPYLFISSPESECTINIINHDVSSSIEAQVESIIPEHVIICHPFLRSKSSLAAISQTLQTVITYLVIFVVYILFVHEIHK